MEIPKRKWKEIQEGRKLQQQQNKQIKNIPIIEILRDKLLKPENKNKMNVLYS